MTVLTLIFISVFYHRGRSIHFRVVNKSNGFLVTNTTVNVVIIIIIALVLENGPRQDAKKDKEREKPIGQ